MQIKLENATINAAELKSKVMYAQTISILRKRNNNNSR